MNELSVTLHLPKVCRIPLSKIDDLQMHFQSKGVALSVVPTDAEQGRSEYSENFPEVGCVMSEAFIAGFILGASNE